MNLESGSKAQRTGKTINFTRLLFSLALPIAFQSLISSLVNMADVVMLSGVSQSALSAVALAGQVTFVLMLFYFGISSGVSILTSQYWGKNDLVSIGRVLEIGNSFSIIVSSAFFLAAFLMPESLMRVLTNNGDLIILGANYLRILSISYLFMSISQIYLGMLRSMGCVKHSAIISSISLAFDTALTALVVFVLFPNNPHKAVAGVAATTMICRIIEFLFCVIYSWRWGSVKLCFSKIFHVDMSLLRDFIKYATPAQCNYLVWGGALTAMAAIMGHVSADMVAANSIASVIKNLVLVICSGVAQGGAALIGKLLGEGNLSDAKLAGGKVVRWAFVFGVIAGGVVLLIRSLNLGSTSLTPEAKSILDGMLLVCAYYCIGKSLNSTVIAGIFFAGGDSKFGFICDAVVMWGVIIPLGLLSAFVFRFSPIIIYAMLCMDEFIKLPFMVIRYKKYIWLKNITRKNEMEEILS